MPLIHYYNDTDLARIPPWFTLTQTPVIYISKALDQASQQVRCKYSALHHQCQLLIQGTHLLLFPSSIGGRTQNCSVLWDFENISTVTYMSPWKESRGSASFHHWIGSMPSSVYFQTPLFTALLKPELSLMPPGWESGYYDNMIQSWSSKILNADRKCETNECTEPVIRGLCSG